MNAALLNIRAMVADDIPWTVDFLTTMDLSKEGDLAQRLEIMLQTPWPLCFVAEEMDSNVGVVLGHFNGFHGFISFLAVQQSRQRRGIARRLHAVLVEKCISYRARGIIVDSWYSSAGLYYKLGYRAPSAVFMILRLEMLPSLTQR